MLDAGKLPFVLGGEHALTAGAIRPFAKRYPKDLVVLHLDSLTTGPRSFSGTFSVDYQSARHNECVCQFWFNYIATAADATDSGS